MLTFTIEGADEIAAEIRRRGAALPAAGRRLIADYGAYQHDLTHQLSPYDELELYDDFHMRENIRTETSDDGLSMEVGWHMEDFTSEGFAPYYFFQEFGTVNMAAQPSLGPAWAELEPHFVGDAKEMLHDTIIEGG